MSNENCLEGFKCPFCGQEDRFRIEVKTVVEFTDEGTETPEGEMRYGDRSYCECCGCHKYGTVKKFRKDK